MKKIFSVTAIVGAVLFSFQALAQSPIPVGEARVKKSVLAITRFKTIGDVASVANQVREVINNDLNFTNLFTFQSESAFIEKSTAGITLDSFRLSDWSTIGTEYLVKGQVSVIGDEITLEARLFDVLGGKQLLGKRYVAKKLEPKTLAHSAANDIMKALTGRPGIFFTKIAMVCEKSGNKEIWTMDFDGSNPRQLTNHKTLAFSPAWSANNRKLAYSLYARNSKNIKNIDLYEYDFNVGQSRLLSNRKGINSGSIYSPDGSGIALTMSFLGNPELFLLNPFNREVTRLTKSFGFDVDPSYSPDGKSIAFVSSRSGQPMVYSAEVNTLKSNPQSAKRLTFAGKYNATPSWAPFGNKIAFAGYLDSHFDIFLMNTDGSNIERLTKDEGNNEDPFFSPDGNFIVFSSNRAGNKNIYVMTADGASSRRLTFGLGHCTSPRWSNALDN